ncbi:MAG: hypothetical protein JRH18_24260 [Deltaproteobacteria bacterium]|nr:hypothetical protein [Deltaproteobacteria bacterium]MBW1995427.1 hypothetical protein [Deltaproteobacteria bacterium]MBW2154762.1 hypothetical protein [Deltaproteobacteria bacterium]
MKCEDASQLQYTYEIGLEAEIAEVLSAKFPVDVRVLNFTPVSFQYQAVRGWLVLDRDPETK